MCLCISQSCFLRNNVPLALDNALCELFQFSLIGTISLVESSSSGLLVAGTLRVMI